MGFEIFMQVMFVLEGEFWRIDRVHTAGAGKSINRSH